jgi:hypothetical protein
MDLTPPAAEIFFDEPILARVFVTSRLEIVGRLGA